MKVMMRGSLWIERRCWGNPWLENFTEEATLMEKQKKVLWGQGCRVDDGWDIL